MAAAISRAVPVRPSGTAVSAVTVHPGGVKTAIARNMTAADGIDIKELIREGDPNNLHMSDWATHCVTQALYEAITNAPAASVATA